LPVFVNDPALVGVGGACVRGAGNDGCGAYALLVGYVVDGKSILVVTVAYVAPVILLVGSTVDDALSIVRVTILGRATLDVWLGRVVSVNKDGTTSAGVITARAATAAKSNGVVLLLVGANGVGTALDTLLNVDPGNIGLDIEIFGLFGESFRSFFMSKNWMPWPAPSDPMMRVSFRTCISRQMTESFWAGRRPRYSS